VTLKLEFQFDIVTPNRTKKLAHSNEKQAFSLPSTQGDVSKRISKEQVLTLTKRAIIGPVRCLQVTILLFL